MVELTTAQIRVLEAAANSAEPLSKAELATTSKVIKSLVEAALLVEVRETIEIAEGQSEERVRYSISEAGREALIAPEEEAAEEKPTRTISDTLIRCLGILADGEIRTYRELNTSSQNIGRLVEKGLATLTIGEDRVKRLQITEAGREELAKNS